MHELSQTRASDVISVGKCCKTGIRLWRAIHA